MAAAAAWAALAGQTLSPLSNIMVALADLTRRPRPGVHQRAAAIVLHDEFVAKHFGNLTLDRDGRAVLQLCDRSRLQQQDRLWPVFLDVAVGACDAYDFLSPDVLGNEGMGRSKGSPLKGGIEKSNALRWRLNSF
jgi:hypothetical protein